MENAREAIEAFEVLNKAAREFYNALAVFGNVFDSSTVILDGLVDDIDEALNDLAEEISDLEDEDED